MRRRLSSAKRSVQSGSESDESIANDNTTTDEPTSCVLGPLPRPSHLLASGNRRPRAATARRRFRRIDGGVIAEELEGEPGGLNRCGNDTVADALIAGWGMREISSILRWALADLAVALMEVERRMILASENKSDGPRRRLPARN
jgi:hypothetical protein